MLDPYCRKIFDPMLSAAGSKIARLGVSANMITLTGLFMGFVAMALIVNQYFYLAFIFIVLNRLCDCLDGAVARHFPANNFGGFLDIVCDMVIYAGIVFAAGFSSTDKIVGSAFLLFSFVGPISSFLAYAIIAEKMQHSTSVRGVKSFYYSAGLCEGVETALVLMMLCLLEQYHNHICFVYGILCWLTTVQRALLAWKVFGQKQAT